MRRSAGMHHAIYSSTDANCRTHISASKKGHAIAFGCVVGLLLLLQRKEGIKATAQSKQDRILVHML